MKVEHTLTVVARCPVDDSVDVYQCTIRTNRLVMVEKITEAVSKLTTAPITQEELTDELCTALGCEVETTGTHGRTESKVTCYPAGKDDDSRYKTGGFEPRFTVTRTDGKPCRAGARYMVLDGSGADPHAYRALRTYADSVRGENSKLADDLEKMLAGNWPAKLAQHGDAK